MLRYMQYVLTVFNDLYCANDLYIDIIKLCSNSVDEAVLHQTALESK